MPVIAHPLSDHLRTFFLAEFANHRVMIAEAHSRGLDPYDETGLDYLPDPTLGSALDSWNQMPDDVRADFLHLADEARLSPVAIADAVQEADKELRRLAERLNANFPLEALL